MTDAEKIAYRLGYAANDELKIAEISDNIKAAEEFMKDAGVPESKLSSARALTIKTIWCSKVDLGEHDSVVKRDGMIVALISQLRGGRTSNVAENQT